MSNSIRDQRGLHQRDGSQLGMDGSLSDKHARFNRLADQLGPSLAGTVYVRSSEDDKRVRPTLSPTSSSSSTSSPSSALLPIDELKDTTSSESKFAKSVKVFNAAAPLAAWMVVCPKNTRDVVTAIKFCRQHQLSPSIKSGGFSTAGWAIQGDLVLDMQRMDSVQMMLPSTYYGRKRAPLDVDMNDEIEVDHDEGAEMSAQAGSTLAPLPKEAAARKVKGEEMSSVDIEGRRLEYAAGEEYIGGSSKRHKHVQPVEEEAAKDEIQPVRRVKSDESGAEADSERSSGQDSSEGSPSARPDSNDGHTANTDLTPLQQMSQATIEGRDSSERTNTWVDKSMRGSTSGSQSGSNSAMSRSGTSNQTSADVEDDSGGVDSDEKEANQPQPRSSAPMNWDPASSFEHERWQKHHCPPGVAVDRAQLPSTGGFIWTSDQADGSSNTRILNTTEPTYMGGTTWSDLQDTSSGNQNNNDCTVDSSMSNVGGLNSWPTPEETKLLQPGIHKDKFALLEMGPGLGIRALDVFSDRAGKMSCYVNGNTAREKGKQRDLGRVDSISVGDAGVDIVAHGVAYHAPLSAYPVGSTAMATGGFGYLTRAYGLSLDNLVEIELVLADGRVVVLNETTKDQDAEHADLWWAARGAAPCFGVMTRLVAKAFPVPRVYAGNLIYPFNPVTAPSLIRHWRDCLKGTGESIPRELYSNLILTAGPPSGSRENVIVIQICYLGTSSADEVGNSFVQAITSWTGERCLLKDITDKSFLSQQDGVAQVLKSGDGRRWMTKGDLLSTLTDDAVYKTVEKFHKMGPNRAVWLFELIGGAIQDTLDTCVGHDQRDAKFTVAALQQWLDEEEDQKCEDNVQNWVSEVLSKVSVGGPFACFLERDESRERCEGSFGKDNFERLLEIKRRVDPAGMFRHTFAGGLTSYM